MEEFDKGKIKENDIQIFEKYLFNRFIKTPNRKYTASSLPIQVMLARPLLDVSQIQSALKGYSKKVLIEKKFDGERVLVILKLLASLEHKISQTVWEIW